MLPVCAILMLQIAKVKEKHSRSVMEAKTKAATQLNEYLHGMKDLKAYHRTGSGFEALKKRFLICAGNHCGTRPLQAAFPLCALRWSNSLFP